MSRIIKANFRPILSGNGYREKHINRPALGYIEPNSTQEADPAAAIVDAAAVTRTARIRAAELLRQAEERVVELVTAAEEQSMAIREEARESGFEAGRSAGYEDGYAAGRAAAHTEVQAEMQREMAHIAQIAQECQQIRSHTISQGERDIVVLSLAIAEKIIRQKIRQEAELAVNIVKDVAMRVQDEERVVIRVHPAIAESLAKAIGEGVTPNDGSRPGWTLLADTAVEPGGCLLETEFGRIDARLETRFLAVSESLLQLLEGE